LRRKETSRLFYGEPRSAALMTGALALEDIGAVCPVLMAALPAPQHVDVLVMVRAGEVGSTDNDLPVSIPVAWLCRPLTHTRSIPINKAGAVVPWVRKATLKFLQVANIVWRGRRSAATCSQP
jgi:hypothetical protein